jgi:GAF domain-containing protein/HAMP domain-containing protein
MTTQLRRRTRVDLRALPIAVKLALTLALVLVLSGFFTAWLVGRSLRDVQTQVVMSDLQSLSRAQAFRVADALTQEITALNRLGANVNLRVALALRPVDVTPYPSTTDLGSDETLIILINGFRATRSEFRSVAIVDASGRLLAVDPLPPALDEVAGENWSWFYGAYNHGLGATYISGPIDDGLTGLQGIHIAVPVYSGTGDNRLLGVLYGVWDAGNVLGVAQAVGQRESLLISPDGLILTAPGGSTGTSLPADLTAKLSSSPSGTFLYTDPGGNRWLYGYVSLADLEMTEGPASDLDWIVITREPFSVVDATVAALLNALALATLASGAMIVLLTLLFTRILLFPLRHLTQAAARLQAGELTTPIPELPLDEVGRLADVLRGLVGRLLYRVGQLRAAVQVSRVTAQTLDIGQLLEGVARALADQFGYPVVHIYLLDASGKNARLHAVAGERGEHWLRVGHRITVDETTPVGRAILLGETQFSSEQALPIWPGAPVKVAQLALPLRAGGRPLGALHLIARPMTVFDQEDIDLLLLIADQLGASVENARLFEQSAANLAEIEALNRRLTRQGWEEFLESRGDALRHTLDPDQRWPQTPEEIRRRSEVKAVVYTDADGRSVLAAPLVLRGETVGSLAVTRPAGEGWSRDEVALLESVATRMAVVAESIRLIEESTRRAEIEQRVNEVSAQLLQRAASVDSVLQNALSQLSGALGSDHVSLRIGPPPVEGDHQISPRSTSGDIGPDGSGKSGAEGDGDLNNGR